MADAKKQAKKQVPVLAPGEDAYDVAANTAKDVGWSALYGLGKGAVGLPGLLADLPMFLQDQIDYGQSRWQGRPLEEVRHANDARAMIKREDLKPYTSKAWQQAAADRLGFQWREPETGLGRVADAWGEVAALAPAGIAFLPGAAKLGIGSLRALMGLGRADQSIAGQVEDLQPVTPPAPVNRAKPPLAYLGY